MTDFQQYFLISLSLAKLCPVSCAMHMDKIGHEFLAISMHLRLIALYVYQQPIGSDRAAHRDPWSLAPASRAEQRQSGHETAGTGPQRKVFSTDLEVHASTLSLFSIYNKYIYIYTYTIVCTSLKQRLISYVSIQGSRSLSSWLLADASCSQSFSASACFSRLPLVCQTCLQESVVYRPGTACFNGIASWPSLEPSKSCTPEVCGISCANEKRSRQYLTIDFTPMFSFFTVHHNPTVANLRVQTASTLFCLHLPS